ncbi:MAG: ATP-binding cassette domain-containing protein [Rhizobiaceae bacterium]
MIAASQNVVSDLLGSYCEQIERLIGEAKYRDAMMHLQDFVRDFGPTKKRIALALSSRYHRWKEAQSLGLAETENINGIVQAALELMDDVRTDATNTLAPAKPSEAPLSFASAGAQIIPFISAYDAPPPPDEEPSGQPEPSTSVVRPTLDQTRKNYFSAWRANGENTNRFVVFQGRDLRRNYRRGFSLGPISIELRAGEITAVVGRNASGKTTFLRMVAGELLTGSGHASYPALQGPDTSWMDVRSRIAFVPQLPDRWHGRLRNTLNYVAATYGARGVQNRELVDWHVTRYGLEQYDSATWDEISGGYKIRFELVRALVSQPSMLVLDEPLAYLDIITRQKFLTDLRSIASSLENPIPILIASQHLYEIEAVADQLVILDDGKCVFSGYLDSLARERSRTIIEVSLRAGKSDLENSLDGLGLDGMEETTEGYILVFPVDLRHEEVFTRLRARFGEEFYAYRDISRSTRSLMSDDPRLIAALAGVSKQEPAV